MNPIYLDYNATTPLSEAAAHAMFSLARASFGNPSSLHWAGVPAKRAMTEARAKVARFIKARPSEMVFTSGGTEADVTAIQTIITSARRQGRVARIIASAAEHHAILHTLEHARSLGDVEPVIIGIDQDGRVRLDALDQALAQGADGLCLMWANNETGAVLDLEAIAQRVRDTGVHWHCDAVQAAGKVPIDISQGPGQAISTLALAAHKLHGPRGIGALFVRQGVSIEPLLPGGSQERGRRSGTENVPGQAGFATATHEASARLNAKEASRLGQLRDRLSATMLTLCPGSQVHAANAPRLPNTLNIAIRLGDAWADGQAIMLALAERGFALSTGAACTSSSKRPSHVLTAMGVSPESAGASLRISLGADSSDAHIDALLKAFMEVKDTAE